MKVLKYGMVAVACWGLGFPAWADDIQIGSVDIGRHMDTAIYSGFGGPVESLTFTAGGSDIFCNRIVVRYEDGMVDTAVANIALDADQPFRFDVPGRAKHVDSVLFTCRSDDHHGRIAIGVEVGRHREAWRHAPDWQNRWAEKFGDASIPPPPPPGRWDNAPPEWIPLARLNFEGSNDSEQAFGGWRGHEIDRIAVRPLNATTRCNRIIATFRNGQTVPLAKDLKMARGEMAEFDLPGEYRDLDQLYMRCHAFGDKLAIVEILVRK